MEIKVVKIGGNIIDNQEELSIFLKDFAQIKGAKILIHGGGKIASELGLKLGIEPHFYQGRRITDAESLKIAQMVYAGLINKNVVAKLQANNCNAIGLTGADGNLIVAKKREWQNVDFGFVGDIIKVNRPLIIKLMESGLVPVFCALTHDYKGQMLNTNADTMAAEIASALASDMQNNVELLYCFEKQGVLENIENENSVIETLDKQLYSHLKETKKIHQGMLPKLENCFYAKQHKVAKVIIGNRDIINKNNAKCTQIAL